jgi:hypothetical protein
MNRTAMVAIVLAILLAPMVRAADAPSDAEIEKQIVGKWLHEDVGGIFNATTA